jgi:glycine betaine catabolism A
MELQAALPRPMYVDPEHWVREREAVLHREWFCVGRRADLGLSGTSRVAVVDVAGESVILTADAAGRLHAAYNVCRHRGSQVVPVESGTAPVSFELGALRCPYHSWTYGLDGRLLRSPHADDLPADDFSLHPVGVGEWAGFVLVHLTPAALRDGAASLTETTAPYDERLANYELDRLVTGATLHYDVAANYKVLLENYNECYHCGPVHPELSRLVPAFAGGGAGLDWERGVEHREGAWTFTISGTTDRAPLRRLTDEERTRHKGELVYPNLLVSCSGDHVAAFVLHPVAVDRTRVECRLLFDPDEAALPSFDPTDAAELWDLVNRQDWAVCESVQRGMSSRAYTHGWFAPMEDDSLDIRRWLLPRLERGADG